MREKGAWSETTYRAAESKVKSSGGGRATFVGEERARQGKGLDPLVDPKAYDVIRQSKNLLVPDGEEFVLEFGVAMPVETDVDTTGSMGGNVDIFFRVQPKVQSLLVQGTNAVLARYHTQMATGVIQDKVDQFPYQRSQFEPDNEVERQMGLLVPERSGGDPTEDYQLSLFALAYLSKTSILQYGLKGYYFPGGDEIGRDKFSENLLVRVFGPTVLEKAFGSRPPQQLPSIKEAAKKVLEDWHTFFLQVNSHRYTTEWWVELIGSERVIGLPRMDDIAETQACIIGLTEGAIDLQNAADYLREGGADKARAARIVEAVRGIPVGLQKTYLNFNKIPMAGSRFASREDIWPIGSKSAPKKSSGEKSRAEKPDSGTGKKKPDWKA